MYFPRELQLLFLHTGFDIDAVYGDYQFGTFQPGFIVMIVVGRRSD
jgi:hypothetical protein